MILILDPNLAEDYSVRFSQPSNSIKNNNIVGPAALFYLFYYF